MTCEHGLTTKECYVCSSPKYGEKKMTTLKTLEMALKALENASYCVQNDYLPDKMGHDWDEVIASLRTQIALEKKAENARELGLDYEPTCKQSLQVEPVAWMHNMIEGVAVTHKPLDLERHPERWVALYKNPTPCKTCEALARTVMMDQGGTA